MSVWSTWVYGRNRRKLPLKQKNRSVNTVIVIPNKSLDILNPYDSAKIPEAIGPSASPTPIPELKYPDITLLRSSPAS